MPASLNLSRLSLSSDARSLRAASLGPFSSLIAASLALSSPSFLLSSPSSSLTEARAASTS